MKTALLTGPVLLLVYQTAPIHVAPDSSGRYRLSFGYGEGQYEMQHFNCAGELTGVDAMPFRTTGVQMDAWPSDRVRLSGFGGSITEGGRARGYGGLVLALEQQSWGVGGGGVRMGGRTTHGGSGVTYPSGYLRFGNIDRLHFRTDMLAPSPVYPSAGVMRLGLGYNQGRLDGVGAFLGLSVAGTDPEPDGEVGTGPFGELRVPVAGGFGLLLQGAWRPSRQFPDWGLGVAGSYEFGR